jgi:hypothetical protein
MRGIPPELVGKKQLHQAKIREIWDRHYNLLDQKIAELGLKPGTAEYVNLVRNFLRQGAKEIDYVLGQFFSESRKAMEWKKSE